MSPSSLDSSFASSSPAFLMMYSAYKLNKQGDNIQPWHTPCPVFWNQSVVPCPVRTVASWPAYRFLKKSVFIFKNQKLTENSLNESECSEEAGLSTKHKRTSWWPRQTLCPWILWVSSVHLLQIFYLCEDFLMFSMKFCLSAGIWALVLLASCLALSKV